MNAKKIELWDEAPGGRRIELSLGPAGWLADFVGNQEIKRLFGTTRIPTPFTHLSPAGIVQAAVQFLNPGAAVIVIGG